MDGLRVANRRLNVGSAVQIPTQIFIWVASREIFVPMQNLTDELRAAYTYCRRQVA